MLAKPKPDFEVSNLRLLTLLEERDLHTHVASIAPSTEDTFLMARDEVGDAVGYISRQDGSFFVGVKYLREIEK